MNLSIGFPTIPTLEFTFTYLFVRKRLLDFLLAQFRNLVQKLGFIFEKG